ncbi:MAG: tRNA pseudouridine(38-40) synthase TruA [Candidatus Zixiibacteriota bacterium]|jgi:tRNA pseudouridine38-40 synthase
MNIRLDIEYKGTDFAGWQYQPGLPTIQGEIEQAIKKTTGKDVAVIGAGRTDAGVHALHQFANFKIEHSLPPEKYKNALNYYLPRTILIKDAAVVDDSFHARRSARWRHYRYLIDTAKSALHFEYRWEIAHELVLSRLNETASKILGEHDFSAFCTVASQKEENSCQIMQAGWQNDGSLFIFDVVANRFLHSMVRSLVGLMVETAKPNDCLTLKEFGDIMTSGDHTRIKHVAPARGLYLADVGY